MEEYGGEKFMPVFNALKENSFDIKKTLQNISPETAAPILKEIFSAGKKSSPPKSGTAGLEPISSVADKEIIHTLNKYFSA